VRKLGFSLSRLDGVAFGEDDFQKLLLPFFLVCKLKEYDFEFVERVFT